MVSLLFVALFVGSAASESIQARSFNGVTATFTIKNPVIRIGENLKVVVVYRNTSDRTVKFRFAHLDAEAELYPKGKSKSIIGGNIGEMPFAEVTLGPGDSFPVEDEVNMKGWPQLKPGDYEIQFFYHLGLLPDSALIKHYQAIYPHDHYVVPWSDRRYGFRLIQ
jgi:hypothetical protein